MLISGQLALLCGFGLLTALSGLQPFIYERGVEAVISEGPLPVDVSSLWVPVAMVGAGRLCGEAAGPRGTWRACASVSEGGVACLCPFGTSYPLDTSRRPKDSEREGQGYSFVSRAEMEADIRAGRYLEHGEYEGNLYGTRIDSIRGVVAAGRVCVLDVNPQVLPGPLLPSLLSGGVSFCLPPSIFLYISKHSPISPQLLLGTQATSNLFLQPPGTPTPPSPALCQLFYHSFPGLMSQNPRPLILLCSQVPVLTAITPEVPGNTLPTLLFCRQ